MKKALFGILILILIVVGVFYLYKSQTPGPKNQSQQSATSTLTGTISSINLSTQNISISNTSGKETGISVNSQVKITDINGNTTDLSNLQKGFEVEIQGQEKNNIFTPIQIKITKEPNIIVYSPQQNEIVGNTITIKGIARVFENQFNIRVSSENKKLVEASVYASSSDVGLYGPFEKTINIGNKNVQKGSSITLEAFDYSPKDGSEIDKVSIPLIYDPEKVPTSANFPLFNISLSYPSYWKPNYKEKINSTIIKYSGSDGFFILNAAGTPLVTLDEVVKNEVNHVLKPYGSNPNIVNINKLGQEAKLIFPSQDQAQELKNQSAFIIKYPKPISIQNKNYSYFILYADKDHIKQLADTLNFNQQTIKIYFNNNRLDPQVSCNKVFPTERVVFKNPSIAQTSIEELLKGPSEIEKSNDFTTSINPGVKIQKLTIKNGTAQIDFNNALQESVGGSCRIASIRAQITQTLKQFTTVKNVIISINGDTEKILQP